MQVRDIGDIERRQGGAKDHSAVVDESQHLCLKVVLLCQP